MNKKHTPVHIKQRSFDNAFEVVVLLPDISADTPVIPRSDKSIAQRYICVAVHRTLADARNDAQRWAKRTNG